MRRDLESFYGETATLLAAGIGLRQALASGAVRGPDRPAALLEPLVAAGTSLADAMDRRPDRFPSFDRAMVRTGEASGRLDEALRRIADVYARFRALRSQVISALLYPLFLLHLGLLLLNLPTFFMAGGGAFLSGLFWSFVPLYAVVGAVLLARRHLREREAADNLLFAVPLLGPLLRKLALSRGTRAASFLYEAGVPVDRAFAVAGDAAGRAPVARRFRSAAAAMRGGRGVHESLASVRLYPETHLATLAVGEQAGGLTEALSRVAGVLETEADAALRAAAKAIPFAIYLAIILFFAIRIFSFWAGYYGQIMSM